MRPRISLEQSSTEFNALEPKRTASVFQASTSHTAANVISEMAAADTCEQRLCRATAMQFACIKRLQAVCHDAKVVWKSNYPSNHAGSQLREARASLKKHISSSVSTLAPQLTEANSNVLCGELGSGTVLRDKLCQALQTFHSSQEQQAALFDTVQVIAVNCSYCTGSDLA